MSSINILLADGLKEIGGKVTKEKIVSALGYTPADKEELPNIVEDESGEFTVADEYGNIIMKVDQDGLSTTNVNTKTLTLDGEDLDSKLKSLEDSILSNILDDESGEFTLADEAGNVIMKVDEDGLSTTNVNTKTLNLDGEDLGEKLENLKSSMLPNILDDESGEFALADEDGNVIMRVDANGTETTTLTAKNAIINGVDITDHASDTGIHVTAAEKQTWNKKSDFSGDYNDLKNAPDILEDESGDLVYADVSGNVIVRIDKDGLETTHVAVDAIVLKDAINGNIYMLQMQNGKLVSFSIALSIQITVPPAKSVYSEGEEFDPTGMVISAICQDGSTREIINYTYSEDNRTITIIYREWKSIHTATLEIIRASIKDLLIDFDYTTNDGTYTIINWKGTLNGQPSTEMVIPDNENIIL